MCVRIYSAIGTLKMTPDELKLRIIFAGTITMIIIITAYHAAALACTARAEKCAQHTSRLSGEQWIQELLSGHEDRIFNEFRMRKSIFLKFLAVLQTHAGVHNSRYVSGEEQLATFLHYAHRGLSNRALQERFQRSGDMISKYVSFITCYVIIADAHLDPYTKSSERLHPPKYTMNMYSSPQMTLIFRILSWVHGARESSSLISMDAWALWMAPMSLFMSPRGCARPTGIGRVLYLKISS